MPINDWKRTSHEKIHEKEIIAEIILGSNS